MTDDTKPDHGEATMLARHVVDELHHGNRDITTVARAYLASQAENAELRQLVGGEFLEASKEKALTEARAERDALREALDHAERMAALWLETHRDLLKGAS